MQERPDPVRLHRRRPEAPGKKPTLVNILRRTWTNFQEDRGGLLAAALSFYVLLSVFPLLLVAVSAAAYFLGGREPALREVLKFAEQYTAAGTLRFVEDALREVIAARGVIGGLGVFGLVWSASQALVTMEEAINAAWDAPARGFLKARAFALGMLLLIGVLFATSFAATSAVALAADVPLLGRIITGGVKPLLGYLLPLLISSVLFAMIYRWFPNARMEWRPALIAGAVTGVLFETAKIGFAFYLGNFADFGAIYGPVGGVVALITWIYYSSFVALLGAELAYTLARPDEAHHKAKDATAAEPDPTRRHRRSRATA